MPGARFAFFDDVLTVCVDPAADNPELLLLDVSGLKPKGITKSSTNRYSGGQAVLGSSGRRLYRLAGSVLMSGELFDTNLIDRQVAQVIGNQTTFFVADNPELTENQEVVFGAQRVFGDLMWFIDVGDTNGRSYSHFEVGLAELDDQESIIDASVRFGAKTVLVLRHTRQRGTNYIRIDLVNIKDGQVISSQKSKVSEVPLFDNIHGKAFTDSHILHATEDGIVMQDLNSGNTLVLPGTENYVSGGEQLMRSGNGVLVFTGDRVLYLKPIK